MSGALTAEERVRLDNWLRILNGGPAQTVRRLVDRLDELEPSAWQVVAPYERLSEAQREQVPAYLRTAIEALGRELRG